MGSVSAQSPASSAVPRLASVASSVSPRRSVIGKLSQFSKPVSVVPYAPERLSITQTDVTPAMIRALADKQEAQQERNPPSRKEDSVTTLFAALRLRRVLHRVQAEREESNRHMIVDETKANLERHSKVLSRYKIRQVNLDTPDSHQLRNLPKYMVNPHSNVYKLWQLLTLVLIIYQSIALPFALAFGSTDTTIIDILTSTVFALDIVVAFNTPVAKNPDETLYITDRCRIASKYLCGWFFFDLLACLPLDYVVLLLTNSKSNLSILGLLKALRVPRLLRLVRLLRLAKIFQLRPELRRWLQYSRHANLLRLVRLVVSFLVINHYVACFWYGVVMSKQTRALDPSTDPLHLYIVAFYQSLLVVMGQNITVYEDNEYVFCVLAMVVGAVLMAVVFGNVAILIANYYESQSSHQTKMEWLFASMNRMKLPYDLQNRIHAYYQAMWERHGTLDGAVTAFIPELSRNLAYEVELFLRMDMINRVPIFQNCSAKVVQELVMELELQVFMPGDYVVVRGEVGNDMYFVQSGVCEVTKEIEAVTAAAAAASNLPAKTPGPRNLKDARSILGSSAFQLLQQTPKAPVDSNELVLKVLSQGDYFGEIALLMNCKRTANVRAQVFSELCTLTREVFESISQRYLEDRTIIETFIMDKYDPSMLHAAMTQSQQVSKMQNRKGNTRASTKTSPPSHGKMSTGNDATLDPGTESLSNLLTKVLERLEHLETQVEKETEARRESEKKLQIVLTEAMSQLARSSASTTSFMENPLRRAPGTLQRSSKAVSEEGSHHPLTIAQPQSKESALAADETATDTKTSKPKSPPTSFKALITWRGLRSESIRLRKSRANQREARRLNGSSGGRATRDLRSNSTSRHSSISRSNDGFIDPKGLFPEPKLRESTPDEERSDTFSSETRLQDPQNHSRA